jgi:hypothetical protein
MLVLTEADAQALCGPKDATGNFHVATADGHSLNPIELKDGVTFILPEVVLDDPAHSAVHAQLAALPMRDVSDDEMKDPIVMIKGA